jgi:cell division control protein 6
MRNPGGDRDEDMLSWDESVFRDEHVFEVDYVPETFDHRETQLESLKYALRPAVRGSRPLNTVVRGPPGTGKTTALSKLFSELSGQPDVRTVHVNSQLDSTRYAVFSRVFEDVFDYEPPSSGISFKKLFGQIADRLVEADETLVVALDDVNYLFYENEASDALYSLLRAHEVHSGARVGVIVVSSDLNLEMMEELDGRVRSVFRPEEVFFPKYDPEEIYDILGERVKRGFEEGVLDSDTLTHVADLTAESGDLRVGIDLLHRAGLNAEMRGSRAVNRADVDEAYEKSKYVHLSRRLRELSESERALVAAVANYEGEQAGEVYDAFHERTGLGYTRYSELLNKLDRAGVLDTEYADVNGRGRSRRIELTHDSDAVLKRLN